MALVVEDGSGVANADSYVSASDAVAFLSARGHTFDATGVEPLLIRAMDALAAFSWKGAKAVSTNALPWPRMGVVDHDGAEYLATTVPRSLVEAQVWLAFYIDAGRDPGAAAEPVVKREKVDVIDTTFAVGDSPLVAVSIRDLPNVWGRLGHLVASDSVVTSSATNGFCSGRATR